MHKKEDAQALFLIGKNLRKFRQLRMMSQERLEMEADISKNTIGAIERGEVNPSFLTFQKIAQILDVSLDDFFKN
jgi:transcriptional regulator with XRE-family HTH domain